MQSCGKALMDRFAAPARKMEQLFASNDQKICLNMAFPLALNRLSLTGS
jgi:hypothetical protein